MQTGHRGFLLTVCVYNMQSTCVQILIISTKEVAPNLVQHITKQEKVSFITQIS